VACVSINGANRLGSNSLPELLVFGARAALAAAAFASAQQEPNGAVLTQANDEARRLDADYLRKTGGQERIAVLRDTMQETMEASAGIYRDETKLRAGLATLRDLQERSHCLKLDDRSHTFNTELTTALELGFMLDVAETIVQAALERRESRGSHQRSDFPARDDNQYLRHTLTQRGPDGHPRIDYHPVTITRWPPGKRVYG
jgi:fumarate reductase flavoprotein subunit